MLNEKHDFKSAEDVLGSSGRFCFLSMTKFVLVTIFCCTGGLLRKAAADPQSKLAELPLEKLLNVKYALENG